MLTPCIHALRPPDAHTLTVAARSGRWHQSSAPTITWGDVHSTSDEEPEQCVVIHTEEQAPPLGPRPAVPSGPLQRVSHLSAPTGGRLRLPHVCPAMRGSPLHLLLDTAGRGRSIEVVDIRRVACPPRPLFVAIATPAIFDRMELAALLRDLLPEIDFRGPLSFDDLLMSGHTSPKGATVLLLSSQFCIGLGLQSATCL